MRVLTVWDPRCHCEASGRLLSTRKQKAVVEAALAEGLITVVGSVSFDTDAVWADIARVHAPSYVSAVRTGEPRELAESQSFAWSPEFADSVVRIWHGHQVAARLALREGLVLHPVSGAHHADYDHGWAFCTFNYLVGAGRALLEQGAVTRVAIVDLDAHIGDGTLALVREDPRFGLFDIAGYSRAIGTLNSTRHVFESAEDTDEYFTALKKLPAFLDAFRHGLVFYQAGMDSYERDEAGAVKGMTGERLGQRDRYVLEAVISREIPTVVNLAGGYLDDGTTVRLHVGTIRIASEVLSELGTGSSGGAIDDGCQ